ncbi:hypothetical protein C8R45DRAFT_1220268 [Mycena sanguinolenta]|nr:hypothetical protein C8R45DRAFT_1220268 [Mycena sanguinolenta]
MEPVLRITNHPGVNDMVPHCTYSSFQARCHLRPSSAVISASATRSVSDDTALSVSFCGCPCRLFAPRFGARRSTRIPTSRNCRWTRIRSNSAQPTGCVLRIEWGVEMRLGMRSNCPYWARTSGSKPRMGWTSRNNPFTNKRSESGPWVRRLFGCSCTRSESRSRSQRRMLRCTRTTRRPVQIQRRRLLAPGTTLVSSCSRAGTAPGSPSGA